MAVTDRAALNSLSHIKQQHHPSSVRPDTPTHRTDFIVSTIFADQHHCRYKVQKSKSVSYSTVAQFLALLPQI